MLYNVFTWLHFVYALYKPNVYNPTLSSLTLQDHIRIFNRNIVNNNPHLIALVVGYFVLKQGVLSSSPGNFKMWPSGVGGYVAFGQYN